MRLFPYWARAHHDGFTALGWSAQSVDDARQHAEQRAQNMKDRVTASPAGREPTPGGYYGADRPLREEIIERFGDEPDPAAYALTRNRNGSVVLNAAQVMFIDIDDDTRPSGGFLSRLFGKKAKQETLPPGLDALAEEGYSLRVYRTAAGWRVTVLDRLIDPAGDESKHVLDTAGADPMYVRLCTTQDCFRARLTPKPWRCDTTRPPVAFPFDNDQQEAVYRDWQRQYEAKASAYTACRFVTTLGPGIVDEQVAPAAELHDDIACDHTGHKPLA